MPNESYSVYPNNLDGYASLPLRQDGVHEIVAADHNRLRDAIVKIEGELGIQPSGVYATVAARLDTIADAEAQITAHIADTSGAHAASAISIVDTNDYYFEDDVEGALEELSSLLPPVPDQIGFNNSSVPNDGIPDFYGRAGTKFVFNISTSELIHKRTQPSKVGGAINGLHIFEISDNTDNGDGYLRISGVPSAYTIEWMAPGDSSFGDSVSIPSDMVEGDELTLSSDDTSKQIRVARNAADIGFSGSDLTENFEIYSMEAVSGYYSLPGTGFRATNYITRTAVDGYNTSRLQCMFGGVVFPADRGTLVLQRKIRGVSDYFPIAVLNLGTSFTTSLRTTGQKVYVPTLDDFDTITLYDRYPIKDDYTLVTPNADGVAPYDDFENGFTRFQIAKYLIPISNSDIIGGTLDSPATATLAEVNADVSSYRILHYKETATTTTFTGDPLASDLYSATDAVWSTDALPIDDHDTDSTVRFSNVFADSNPNRPGIELVNLRPEPPVPTNVPWYPAVDEPAMRSGVRYYNGVDDLFEIELRSDNNIFNKTYVSDSILTFESDVFLFPHETADSYQGNQVNVDELCSFDQTLDPVTDAYVEFSNSNLPAFEDQAFYIVNDFTLINSTATNGARRLYPASDRFSTHSYIIATLHDPFGPGDGYDAYGAERINRILVNSYDTDRATNITEYFTDESKRISDSIEFVDVGRTADGYAWTSFDSTAVLPLSSLQVGGRFTDGEFNTPGLIYPQNNYKSAGASDYVNDIIRPTQGSASNMDYSGSNRNGSLTYRRLFTLGYPISSGRLRVTSGGNAPISFEDIRYGNIDRFGKIEIKIPGYSSTNSTGWMDIGRPFSTGQYEDGYGALYGGVTGSAGDFTVPFTFGTRNTAGITDASGSPTYAMAVRITYFGTSSAQRQAAEQKILTMIQLLSSS